MLPQTGDGNMLLHLTTLPGTSLPEMDRVTGRMVAELRTVPGVASVGAHIGRAVTSDQTVDVNSAELWLTTRAGTNPSTLQRSVSRIARGYPGVSSSLVTYPADRVETAASSSGQDLVVRVFGQDYAAMSATAAKLKDAIAGVDGVRSPAVQEVPQQPTAQIEVDLAAAQKYGLRPGDVRRAATTLTSGLTVGNLYDEARIFDVVVLGTPATRANLTTLGDMLIDTPSGHQVALKEVAKVTVGPQSAAIVHDEVMRSMDVVASVAGRSPSAVAAGVRAATAKVPMPEGMHIQVLGAATVRHADARRVLAWTALIVMLIFLVLQAATASWSRSVVLLLVIPLGAAGGVLTAPLAGGVRTAGALAGLFAALALTARTALVLVNRIGDLERAEPDQAGRPAAIAAASERAVPVLRGAMVTAGVMVPAVVLGGLPGVEILRPIGVTVLGGLVTSVFVTIFVIPALCGALPGPRPPSPVTEAAEPAREPVHA